MIKEREYKLTHNNQTNQWVVTALHRDNHNVITHITARRTGGSTTQKFTRDEFKNAHICITNTELFIMYTNWKNFTQGPFKDISFANETLMRIINSLRIRGYVTEGAGKLELCDLKILQKLTKSNNPN